MEHAIPNHRWSRRRSMSVSEGSASLLRSKTTGRTRSRSFDTSLAACGSASSLYRFIKEARLRPFNLLGSNYIDTATEYLNYRLPSQIVDQRALDILRLWFTQPLLVPDTSLSKILRFRECTKNSPRLDSGSVSYFRSWTMQASEFRRLIEDFATQGHSTDHWNQISIMQCSDDKTITVRYVGTTCAPRSPWKRAMIDDVGNSTGIALFQAALYRLLPEIAKSQRVYVLEDTRISGTKKNSLFHSALQLLEDDFERSMIHFFGPQTLLNRQLGGKTAVWSPSDKDESTFLKCQTQLLFQLEHSSVTENLEVTNQITNIFNSWFTYGAEQIWKDALPPNMYIINTYKQAIPKQIGGVFLAAICALEPPRASILDGEPFFSGKRKTSQLVNTILKSVASLENAENGHNVNVIQSLIGFNQLLNWPGLDGAPLDMSKVSRNER